MAERMRTVCPLCGSAELFYELGGATGKVYHCKDCDYVGPFVVEADEEMIRALKEGNRDRSSSPEQP